MSVRVVDNSTQWSKLTKLKIDQKLDNISNGISKLSRAYAPRDTGALGNSHKKTKLGQMKYEVSANTRYAAVRHDPDHPAYSSHNIPRNKNPGTYEYLKRAGDQLTKNLGDKLR